MKLKLKDIITYILLLSNFFIFFNFNFGLTFLLSLSLIYIQNKFNFFKNRKLESLGLVLFLIASRTFFTKNSLEYFIYNLSLLTELLLFISLLTFILNFKTFYFTKIFLPSMNFLSFILCFFFTLYSLNINREFNIYYKISSPYFTFYFFYKIFTNYYTLKSEMQYYSYTLSRYLVVFVLLLSTVYSVWYLQEWRKINSIIKHSMENSVENGRIIPEFISIGTKVTPSDVLKNYLCHNHRFDILDKLSSIYETRFKLTEEISERVFNFHFFNSNYFLPPNSKKQIGIQEIYEKYEIQIPSYKLVNQINFKINRLETNSYMDFEIPEGSVITKFEVVNNFGKIFKNSETKNSPDLILSKLSTFKYRVYNFSSINKSIQSIFIEYEALLKKDSQIILNSPEYLNTQLFLPIQIELNFKNQFSNQFEFNSPDYYFEKNFSGENSYKAKGNYKKKWTILFNNDTTQNSKYTKNIQIDEYILILENQLKKTNWIEIYKSLPRNKKIHLVSKNWFTPRNLEEGIEFIKNEELIDFYLIPFTNLQPKKKYHILTTPRLYEFSLFSLEPSLYFDSMIDYFLSSKNNIYFTSLNYFTNSYLNDLDRIGFINLIPFSNDYLAEIDLCKIKSCLEINSNQSDVIQKEKDFYEQITLNPTSLIKRDLKNFKSKEKFLNYYTDFRISFED